jgi:nitrate/nitrite transport system ATP-binding protein
MTLLELDNVTHSYGGPAVLRQVGLAVAEGECVSIIGYSGTGKTTLMSLLAGLIRPETGVVRMGGEVVNGPGPERGLVFQNYSLLPWLTVTDNIRLAVEALHPEWPKSRRDAHVERYVRMVKLTHAAGRYPSELSGGMRQRVSLARTLAMEPKVLLLDEPLSALDALTRAQLQDEIGGLWERERTTVVWVTNDPDEALLMADRIVPLLPGDGAGAFLGEEMRIDLPRPRDRVTIGQDRRYQEYRRQLITTLVQARPNRAAQAGSVELPDILPEDIMGGDARRRDLRRGPRRRRDVMREPTREAVV